MDLKSRNMNNQFLKTSTTTAVKPCTKCQYGIFDAPVDGKLNCLEEGTSKIKLLTREEVDEMMFCDKMVPWVKLVLGEKYEDIDSDINKAERILQRR